MNGIDESDIYEKEVYLLDYNQFLHLAHLRHFYKWKFHVTFIEFAVIVFLHFFPNIATFLLDLVFQSLIMALNN